MSRPSPSMIVALIALVIAIGGTGYASVAQISGRPEGKPPKWETSYEDVSERTNIDCTRFVRQKVTETPINRPPRSKLPDPKVSHREVPQPLECPKGIVDTDALAKDAVTRAKLAETSVGSGIIDDGAVRLADLHPDLATKLNTIPLSGGAGARGPQGEQGLQGPKGDKGDKGDTGAQGPAGTAGPSNLIVRIGTENIPATAAATAIANCNSGERAVGGGGTYNGTSNGSTMILLGSYPSTGGGVNIGGTPTGWNAVFYNYTGAPIGATAWVVCAS